MGGGVEQLLPQAPKLDGRGPALQSSRPVQGQASRLRADWKHLGAAVGDGVGDLAKVLEAEGQAHGIEAQHLHAVHDARQVLRQAGRACTQILSSTSSCHFFRLVQTQLAADTPSWPAGLHGTGRQPGRRPSRLHAALRPLNKLTS